MASRQPTITEALNNMPSPTAQPTDGEGIRIALHFKPRRKKGSKRNPASKRKPTPTIAPLRGSDARGGNASILNIVPRAEPRKVKYNRRFTYVEEFLVQWGPEICTLNEAQEQYTMGFNIVSIASLDPHRTYSHSSA